MSMDGRYAEIAWMRRSGDVQGQQKKAGFFSVLLASLTDICGQKKY